MGLVVSHWCAKLNLASCYMCTHVDKRRQRCKTSSRSRLHPALRALVGSTHACTCVCVFVCLQVLHQQLGVIHLHNKRAEEVLHISPLSSTSHCLAERFPLFPSRQASTSEKPSSWLLHSKTLGTARLQKRSNSLSCGV